MKIRIQLADAAVPALAITDDGGASADTKWSA